MRQKIKNGFSILEIIVSISLFVLIIVLTSSMFSLASRSYNAGNDKSELLQNIRVSLDKISREIRQSPDIVSYLPPDNNDPNDPPPNFIIFENGHDDENINYIEYKLNGSNLIRINYYYYFPPDIETRVKWNTKNAFNESPASSTIESSIIGEYFTILKFFGNKNLINVEMGLEKNQKKSKIKSSVYKRN